MLPAVSLARQVMEAVLAHLTIQVRALQILLWQCMSSFLSVNGCLANNSLSGLFYMLLRGVFPPFFASS